MSSARRSIEVLGNLSFSRMASRMASLVAPALAVTALALAAACGGGAKEGSDPKNAAAANAGGAGGSNGDPAGGSSSEKGTPPTGAGTTTTTALGDGGDLQGAKLGGSSHIEIESKGDGGPKSTHGQSSGEPGRTPKDIQAIIAARRDDARACYDKGLKDHPGIEGDLDIKWVIDPAGNVTDAQLDSSKSTILEASVATCIVEVIKKIKFAASAKGYETRAHYPFNFHPRNFTAKDGGAK